MKQRRKKRKKRRIMKNSQTHNNTDNYIIYVDDDNKVYVDLDSDDHDADMKLKAISNTTSTKATIKSSTKRGNHQNKCSHDIVIEAFYSNGKRCSL